MKIKSLVTMSILSAAISLAPLTFAEDANDAHDGGKGWHKHHGERFANLSPEEREKLKAAHQKAMQDPALQAAHVKMRQARKEFRDAMHAALLKADPSIQPVIDKMKAGEKDEHDED
ncbi:MAG: hypothetical protein QOI04_583 [Verrucomicrobiota bacterium]